MDEQEKDKQLIETRRAEAMALFTTAHGYNARNDKLVAFGVTLIGAFAALGLKEKFDEVLLGVPVALLLLMIYASQVDADVRVMGVARQRLEEVLESQLGAPALIYQSRAAQFRQGKYIRGIIGVQIVVMLVAIGAALAGGDVANDKDDLVPILYWTLLAALSICLALALWEKGKAESRARAQLKTWGDASGAAGGAGARRR